MAGLSAGLLAGFIAASLLLALTPGPGVVYIVTRTLAQGRACGLASVAGVALGNLGNAVAAVLGLAAVLAVSATAFTAVKLAGAAYLLWLAVQALRGRKPDAGAAAETGDAPTAAALAAAPVPWRRVFRDGAIVALLNPKTTLFFAAFLPQFVTPGPQAAAQGLALGTLFVAIAAVTDSGYVLLAGMLARSLATASPAAARWQRRGRWATAALYAALAAYTAWAGPRPASLAAAWHGPVRV